MKQKSILIVCYHFYPEITPRAFRAYELAKEFSSLGHKVSVVLPDNSYDYNDIINEHKIKIIKIKSGYLFNKNVQFDAKDTQDKSVKIHTSILYKLLKKIFFYTHPNGRKFEYFWPLFMYLKKEKHVYDLTISIAIPISTHFGVALGRLFNKNFTKVAVADYGDPFTYNSNKKQLFYYKYLEKFWLNSFEYVSVPIESAINAFNYFNIKDKIKIIPQGFDMSHIRLLEYKKKDIPHFAYAGIFYENIRNPKILFDFLLKIKQDFRFILYTNKNDLKLVKPYIDKLNDKLIIKDFIPREECIMKLSQYDFLINMQNVSSVQSPSKLIDYAITKRPVFNFDQNNFDQKMFLDFLNRQYSYQFINDININEYNIINIVTKYLQLLEIDNDKNQNK